jgi:hypothetical protein
MTDYIGKFEYQTPVGSVQAELVVEAEDGEHVITIQDHESGEEIGTFFLTSAQATELIKALGARNG